MFVFLLIYLDILGVLLIGLFFYIRNIGSYDNLEEDVGMDFVLYDKNL